MSKLPCTSFLVFQHFHQQCNELLVFSSLCLRCLFLICLTESWVMWHPLFPVHGIVVGLDIKQSRSPLLCINTCTGGDILQLCTYMMFHFNRVLCNWLEHSSFGFSPNFSYFLLWFFIHEDVRIITIKCYFMDITPLIKHQEDISLVKQIQTPLSISHSSPSIISLNHFLLPISLQPCILCCAICSSQTILPSICNIQFPVLIIVSSLGQQHPFLSYFWHW